MQAQILSTISATYDLSPQTPDGQMLGIYAASTASLWELLQICYNQWNRQDTEGAGLDNLGALTGTPREGTSFTLVYAYLALAAGTYAAGSLVANVVGLQAQTFSNQAAIVTAGGTNLGPFVFQATTAGPTPTVNAGTLTQIPTPVTGWTAITNPAASYQAGANAELDPAYAVRQAEDVAGTGTCTAASCAAQLNELGAAQVPPQTLVANVLENTGNTLLVINGLTLPPHTYAPIAYDGGSGWATGAGQALVLQTIYNNKPGGIISYGTTSGVVVDPYLGNQTVSYTIPTGLPLFVSVAVVLNTGYTLAAVTQAIQSALVAAAVAPTGANGQAPTGQLGPGTTVTFGALYAVIMGVPGVSDIQFTGGVGAVPQLFFGFSATPANQAPLLVNANQVATILSGTVTANVTVTAGAGP